MKRRVFAVALLTVFAASMIASVIPVMAMGPKNSQGNKVVQVGNFYIIASNRGFRQWKINQDRFAICLFTEGMTQKAIDAHLANGWNGPYTIGAGDVRYPVVSGYVEGPPEIIWKFHDIPAGPP